MGTFHSFSLHIQHPLIYLLLTFTNVYRKNYNNTNKLYKNNENMKINRLNYVSMHEFQNNQKITICQKYHIKRRYNWILRV
jgi:hypothetical protein